MSFPLHASPTAFDFVLFLLHAFLIAITLHYFIIFCLCRIRIHIYTLIQGHYRPFFSLYLFNSTRPHFSGPILFLYHWAFLNPILLFKKASYYSSAARGPCAYLGLYSPFSKLLFKKDLLLLFSQKGSVGLPWALFSILKNIFPF